MKLSFETFGLFLILSIISMNSVNLLAYIFNNYNTKSTKITSSNLFLVNNFTKTHFINQAEWKHNSIQFTFGADIT